MRNIKNEIRDELLKLFEACSYKTFMRRVKQTQFDIAAHFQNIQHPFLHEAALNDDAEMAAFLLDHGFDVDRLNLDLDTPLHIASLYHAPQVADVLLKAGANPNAVNRNGETPLHLAAVESNLDVIRKLVRSGAKLDQRSYFFMDPNVPHITPVEQAAAGRNENAKGREAYEYFDNSHDLMADRFVFLNADQADKIEAILECQNPFVQKGVAEFNAIQIAILSGRFHEAFSKISPARQPVFLAEVIAVQSENLELLDYTDQFKPLLNAKFWQKAPDQFDVFIKALPNTLRAKHKNKLDFIQARFALKRDDKRSLNIKRRPKP